MRDTIDYMRAATPEDRRYLLFDPITKMKVTTEGERVIDLLWDVIAARGFEADTYFEAAARDIRALPKLEGTVHVNMVNRITASTTACGSGWWTCWGSSGCNGAPACHWWNA